MKNLFITFGVFLITSCGGGGGGGGESTPPVVPPTPSPTVTLSADPTTVYIGNSTTLTWTSTNASSCAASGDWTGSKSTSGNEDAQVTKEGTSTYTITCTNSSGSAVSNVSVTGENLYTYADWESHSLVMDDIQRRHEPYNTRSSDLLGIKH